MDCKDILNLAALIIGPVASVLISIYFQNRLENRKDKMKIFKTLMTARVYGWTRDSVEAMNIIDVVFADDKKVRKAWTDLYDKLNISDPGPKEIEKITNSKHVLLQEMANSVGLKKKISWVTIQNPYIPVGIQQQIELQRKYSEMQVDAVESILKIISPTSTQSSHSSDESK